MRPAQVQKVCEERYATLTIRENSFKSVGGASWVNVGKKADEKIFLNQNLDHLLVFELIADQLSKFPPTNGTKLLLDLGTASGSLLRHVHESMNVSFDQLVGVSATDMRQFSDSIPSSSYLVCNLDDFARNFSLARSGVKFRFVNSSCTCYHLVDPFLGTELVP